eukprot:4673363-Pleurochrysis_carterae.AAC.1
MYTPSEGVRGTNWAHLSAHNEEEVKDATSPQGDLGAARCSRERVAGAHEELACEVNAKEAATRTASFLTSDQKPLT